MNFEFVSFIDACPIATSLANYFNKKIIRPTITQFADGELEITFANNDLLNNKKIFIIQSTYPPVHDNLMRLLFTSFALKNRYACEIIGIIPYFGYARHDKEQKSALECIATMFQTCGISTIITIALHTKKAENFFSIPVHSISIESIIVQHIQHLVNYTNVVLVAPDQGAHQTTLNIAHMLNAGYILCTKERYATNETKIIDGHINKIDSTAYIIDDIIDTGSTALNTCNYLINLGFKEIYGYFIHPVLSGNALQKIDQSILKKVFVSQTIPIKYHSTKFETFSITQELAKQVIILINN